MSEATITIQLNEETGEADLIVVGSGKVRKIADDIMKIAMERQGNNYLGCQEFEVN